MTTKAERRGTINDTLRLWMDNGGVECWCRYWDIVQANGGAAHNWHYLVSGKLDRSYTPEVSARGEYVHGFVVDELGNVTAMLSSNGSTRQYMGRCSA